MLGHSIRVSDKSPNPPRLGLGLVDVRTLSSRLEYSVPAWCGPNFLSNRRLAARGQPGLLIMRRQVPARTLPNFPVEPGIAKRLFRPAPAALAAFLR